MLRMFALVAAVSLVPTQVGKLELINVRPTYGMFGVPRPDTKILPGDVYWVAFDLENVKTDASGKVYYGMGLEVFNSKGMRVFGEAEDKDRPLVADNSLGGTRLPAFARFETGVDFPPGDYTLKVTVSDRTAKTSATLERKFTVLPPAFGLVRLSTSYDQQGLLPAPMLGVPGQFIHVNFAAVGFQRDKTKKQPHLVVEMRIYDEKGKPVLDKPDVGVVDKDVAETARGLPMGFPLALNRPGRFTVELKATDMIAKTASPVLRFPLVVLPNDK